MKFKSRSTKHTEFALVISDEETYVSYVKAEDARGSKQLLYTKKYVIDTLEGFTVTQFYAIKNMVAMTFTEKEEVLAVSDRMHTAAIKSSYKQPVAKYLTEKSIIKIENYLEYYECEKLNDEQKEKIQEAIFNHVLSILEQKNDSSN